MIEEHRDGDPEFYGCMLLCLIIAFAFFVGVIIGMWMR